MGKDVKEQEGDYLYWVFGRSTGALHSGPYLNEEVARDAMPRNVGVVYGVRTMYTGLTTRKAAKSNG